MPTCTQKLTPDCKFNLRFLLVLYLHFWLYESGGSTGKSEVAACQEVLWLHLHLEFISCQLFNSGNLGSLFCSKV